MAFNTKLIYFETKDLFLKQLDAKQITNTSIAFIKSTGELWTHGKLFAGNFVSKDSNKISLTLGGSSIELSKAGHTHSYLPLSGGTLTIGTFYGLTIKRSDTNGSAIQFSNSSGALAGVGVLADKTFVVSSGSATDGGMFKVTSAGRAYAGGIELSKVGHTHNYLPLSGGTLTGALNFANGTWNKLGDDVYMGDYNVANHLCVKANSGTTVGIAFFNSSNGAIGKLSSVNNTLQWNGTNISLSNHNHDDRYVNISGDTMTGTLIVSTKGTGSYNLGIRINRTAADQWATLAIGYVGTGTSGTSDNTWLIGTPGNSNSLIFNRNSANESSGLCLKGHGNTDMKWNNNTVWHSGNDGSGSGLDADLLDGLHSNKFTRVIKEYSRGGDLSTQWIKIVPNNTYARNTFLISRYFSGLVATYLFNYDLYNTAYHGLIQISGGKSLPLDWYYDSALKCYYLSLNSNSSIEIITPYNANNTETYSVVDNPTGTKYTSRTIAGLDSNVASATKLQTPRTLWGRSFDGTANISGNLDGVGNIAGSGVIRISSPNYIDFLNSDYGITFNTNALRPLLNHGNAIDLGNSTGKWKNLYLGSNAYIDGNIEKVNKITSAFSSGTWISSLKNAVINCNINGFGAWINGKTKNGRIAIATYPADNDKIYIGYAAQSKIDAGTDNSYTTNMTWNGATGKLYTTGNTEAKGFVKHNSSDSYLLLGGGGQKAVSDFALASSLNNYVTLTSAQTISGVKTFSSLLKFTVANGTSPFTVSSSTTVTNLNADMLDSLHASSFMRTDGTNGISLTGGNGDTAGWRLVLEKTCGDWSICNIVIAVASRHSGQGVLSIGFHTTNKSGTTYSYNIQFKGSTTRISSPAWRAFYNTSTKKFRLFWNYSDYNGALMNVLSRSNFDVPKNGTWYEALPSDNGTELTILYNVASQLGTATVGSTTVPIYLSAGVPKACSASTSATASTIAVRDSSGDIACRLVRPTYANLTTISGAIAYRINNSNDNYIRFCSDTAAIRTWLGVSSSSHTHTVFNNNLMIKGTNGTSSSASIHLGIGDSDTGFKWVSDGVCQIYANNVAIGQWNTSGMNWLKLPTVNGLKIWHAGNDGSGSGLDADTVDGVHNGSLTASNLASQGNKTAVSGNTAPASGVRLYQVYTNGYPTNYGNLLSVKGAGAGELLLSWYNSNRIYYRSLRDNGDNWLGWSTVAFITDNVASANKLTTSDTNDINNPNWEDYKATIQNFGSSATGAPPTGDNANAVLSIPMTKHGTSGMYSYQLAFCSNREEIYARKWSAGTRGSWYGIPMIVSGRLKKGFSSVECTDWFRSIGNTGWVNDTYGGGWYMQDSNWIRAFNNKSVYTNGTILAGKLVTTSTGIDINYGNNNEFIRVGYNGSDGDFVTFKVPGDNNQSKWMKLSSSKGLDVSGLISATSGCYSKYISLSDDYKIAISDYNKLHNGTINMTTRRFLSHDECVRILTWEDIVNNYGYITYYGIGSSRPANSNWGRMYLAVGNNNNGNSIGGQIEIWGNGKVMITGDLSITGNITAPNFYPNGSSSHPIVLASGYIDVTNGTFHGCKNSNITSITGGIMLNAYRITINNAVMTSIVVQLRSTTSISGNSTSGVSRRGDGAYWFSTYIINESAANIRCFCLANGDNDSWISRGLPWSSKVISSISVTIFGYCR